MKDQKEIYEALILGKTLVHTFSGDMVKIINGMQATKTGDNWDESQGSWTFEDPKDWQIVKEENEEYINSKSLEYKISFEENKLEVYFEYYLMAKGALIALGHGDLIDQIEAEVLDK